ncbi:MAG: P1 family peptidase [Trueperaceae bacterium]|nr:P1 family peptidase [Trueperaceae bacterium]
MSDSIESNQQRPRARDLGLEVGIFKPGPFNAITDVAGVKVGHKTLWQGDDIRTGVTAILPHEGNLFQKKVPAAIYLGNAFGKLAGYTQLAELGTLETPIALTNTLSVAAGLTGLIRHTLEQSGNENVTSVNAVVGETNDSFLNDIRGMHVTDKDVLEAIGSAEGGRVKEGSIGAGTGTTCFGFKGGIGTSSRILPHELGGYTLGVLVQTNYGGLLTINGAPVGKELGTYPFHKVIANQQTQGSCMIVLATDAPLSPRNLKRLAKRSLFGLAKTGSPMFHGSGDYAIAFSTAYTLQHSQDPFIPATRLVANIYLDALFLAIVEATEEAVYNSLFCATTVTGFKGNTAEAIPLEQVITIIKKFGRIP